MLMSQLETTCPQGVLIRREAMKSLNSISLRCEDFPHIEVVDTEAELIPPEPVVDTVVVMLHTFGNAGYEDLQTAPQFQHLFFRRIPGKIRHHVDLDTRIPDCVAKLHAFKKEPQRDPFTSDLIRSLLTKVQGEPPPERSPPPDS